MEVTARTHSFWRAYKKDPSEAFAVCGQDQLALRIDLIVTGIVLAGGPADDPSLEASFGNARRSPTTAAPDEA